MSIQILPIPISDAFWNEIANYLINNNSKKHKNINESYYFEPNSVVLVPNYNHKSILLNQISNILKFNFIPPEILTFSDFVKKFTFNTENIVTSNHLERLLELYYILTKQKWLLDTFVGKSKTDFIYLASDLLDISDELTNTFLKFINEKPEFIEKKWNQAISQFPKKIISLFSKESKLIYEIWKAQIDLKDPVLKKHKDLIKLSEMSGFSLIWCIQEDLNFLQQDFLVRFSKENSVTLIKPDWSGKNIPSRWLTAWPEIFESKYLVKNLINQNNDIFLSPGNSLENEAQNAAQTIINWINSGRKKIAVIPKDRVVTRRLRALLERANIFINDEVGWELSTTKASSIIMTWIDLVISKGNTTELLEFLRSPFLLKKITDREELFCEIEKIINSKNFSDNFQEKVLYDDVLFSHNTVLKNIRKYLAKYTGKKTIFSWINLTFSIFKKLGIYENMLKDDAAHQLIDLLEKCSLDTENIYFEFTLIEWKFILNYKLEKTKFKPFNNDDRVNIINLENSQLQNYDSAIILGFDNSNFPIEKKKTFFFNDSVRKELGLASVEKLKQNEIRLLIGFLLNCKEIIFSWQVNKNKKKNSLNYWILRLQFQYLKEKDSIHYHKVKFKNFLLKKKNNPMPVPVIKQLLPSKLSASSYNILETCPYKFFVSKILNLSELRKNSDLVEKRDYGNWIHNILFLYHEELSKKKILKDHRFQLIEKITEDQFRDVLLKFPLAMGYYAKWIKLMKNYVEWANNHEEKGWHYDYGEKVLEENLFFKNGRIKLFGKIDRVDKNINGKFLIIDYKTSNKNLLKKKIKDLEDSQLAFYGLLFKKSLVKASYLSLNDDMPELVELKNFDDNIVTLEKRIVNIMQLMFQGTGLPASGSEKNCKLCGYRGICRKGEWQ